MEVKRLSFLFLFVCFLQDIFIKTVQCSNTIERNVERPNFILILADDLGYNDIGSFGSVVIRTKNLDRMAREGMKLTQFYADGPLCTPSRGAMLTGRLPIRTGLYTKFQYPIDELFRVFYPTSLGCLPTNETTIAEALKPRGYETAMIGKWHLGHNPHEHCSPNDQGFDYFFGLPYSHEEGNPGPFPNNMVFPPVPLYRNRKILEQPVDLETITSRMTNETIQFIESSVAAQNPFFIHIGYEEPHVPLFASKEFLGISRRGLYGDAVEQMDSSIGQILDALSRMGIENNTLVFFGSDNGAWINPSSGVPGAAGVPEYGGSNAPFREGKGSTWEGGIRVPAIAWWPGHVAPGSTSFEPATYMDIFPTFLDLSGASHPPPPIAIDGKSLKSVLLEQGSGRGGHSETENTSTETGKTGDALHEFLYFWRESNLMAVRYGPFKAHFITRAGFELQKPTYHDPPLLFNVETDPGETWPLDPANHQNILDIITKAAQEHEFSIERGPAQYDAQDYSVVPCCHSPDAPSGFLRYLSEGAYDLAFWDTLGCVCERSPHRHHKSHPYLTAETTTAIEAERVETIWVAVADEERRINSGDSVDSLTASEAIISYFSAYFSSHTDNMISEEQEESGRSNAEVNHTGREGVGTGGERLLDLAKLHAEGLDEDPCSTVLMDHLMNIREEDDGTIIV